MLGVCLRYVGDLHDAEDVLQDGFVKVFTHLSSFRFEGPLEGWIRRIMVTTSLNFLKKRKRLGHELNEKLESDLLSPFSAEQPLLVKDIMKELCAMAPGYRTIINLYAIEGYSHKEIATMLGIQESTSRSQYARARQILLARIQLQPMTMAKQRMHE